jgi:acetolactate synthase-1/2/3 large subunit
LVDDPQRILFELDRAVWNCFTGRMGPCLIDICDDVQRALVYPADLPRFEGQSTSNIEIPNAQKLDVESTTSKSDREEPVVQLLRHARRPLLVLGAGVRSANAIELAKNLIEKLQLPFALTWGLLDSFAHDNELCIGTFGVTSGKAGNFIVQNADLLIVIGSRLDTHEIGNNASQFAPKAKKIMVDIDTSEIDKFQNSGMVIDEPIIMDCRLFMQRILARDDLSLEGIDKEWISYIAEMKTKYPSCSETDRNQTTQVNPYFFMNQLSQKISNNAAVITDCGSNLIWTMQGMTTGSSRQRIISAWNHSPMGYALPAAVGAFFAGRHDQIVCITGDGGLQINIQELATIQRHALPLKIFVMNNHGHGIIQGTQDQWLDGSHVASSESGGLPDPDFASIFRAYGITTIVCVDNSSVDEAINAMLNVDGPIACIVDMQAGPQIYPKLLAGKAIHESFPLVTEAELSTAMRF